MVLYFGILFVYLFFLGYAWFLFFCQIYSGKSVYDLFFLSQEYYFQSHDKLFLLIYLPVHLKRVLFCLWVFFNKEVFRLSLALKCP